nr:anaerobic ribonucleoside-triphosphate reductase activating protein [Candidatus Gracilibacteria bacterium]
MLIGAVNKFSLLDFPGETSCIVFTVGCNFRCSYCHNPEFVLPEMIKNTSKNLIPENIFFNFLEKRKNLLTGVSICGGEPTLQKDLYDFCKKVKDMGFKVKLDTNGRDFDIIKNLLDDNLLDYIAMDVKNPLEDYNEITKINDNIENYSKSIEIIMKSKVDYEFRTTVIKGFHTFESLKKIFKLITGAKKYYIQNFRNGDILDRNFEGISFSKAELLNLKEMALQFVKYVEIRD